MIRNKIIILVLCLTVFLCSCTRSDNTDITTTNSTATTEITQQNSPTDFAETTQAEPTTVEIPTNPNDPYSVFIKERYENIYAAQKAEGAKYFNEFDKHSLNCYYFIYDIDGNGVDELILGDWKRIGGDIEDPDPPKKIMINTIYTLKDGKLIEQDLFNWWLSESYLDTSILSNGVFKKTCGAEKYNCSLYLYFSDDKMTFKETLIVLDDGQYAYNETPLGDDIYISEEEYNQKKQELEGDAEPIEINWKRIDEYGR